MKVESLKKYNMASFKIIMLCLIAVGILFKLNLGNLTIIIAIIFTLFFFKKENLHKFKTFAFIFPLLFLVITIMSSLFSKKYIQGLKHTDLELLPLLISVIIINTQFQKEKLKKIFNWFYYGSVLSSSILLLNFGIKYLKGLKADDLIFHEFTAIYDQHPVYYSMFLSLALFYQLAILKANNRRLVFILLNLVLISGIIFCASKAVLFVNIITYIFYYYFRMKQLKKRIIYVLIILITTLSIFNITFIKDRFVDGLKFNSEIIEFTPTNDFSKKKIFTYEEKTQISDLELRYILWRIGIFHLFEDNKLFFGYGQGDIQTYLDYYYFSYNLGPNWNEGRNLHNQYLHTLVTYGLLVFIFFFSYLVFSFYNALKNNNVLYLFFLAMISFVFIFEVVLVRNKGIIFFYFFNTLFLLNPFNFENSNFRNTRSA